MWVSIVVGDSRGWLFLLLNWLWQLLCRQQKAKVFLQIHQSSCGLLLVLQVKSANLQHKKYNNNDTSNNPIETDPVALSWPSSVVVWVWSDFEVLSPLPPEEVIVEEVISLELVSLGPGESQSYVMPLFPQNQTSSRFDFLPCKFVSIIHRSLSQNQLMSHFQPPYINSRSVSGYGRFT